MFWTVAAGLSGDGALLLQDGQAGPDWTTRYRARSVAMDNMSRVGSSRPGTLMVRCEELLIEDKRKGERTTVEEITSLPDSYRSSRTPETSATPPQQDSSLPTGERTSKACERYEFAASRLTARPSRPPKIKSVERCGRGIVMEGC